MSSTTSTVEPEAPGSLERKEIPATRYLRLARWLVHQGIPGQFSSKLDTDQGQQDAAETIWGRHHGTPVLNGLARIADAESPVTAIHMALALISTASVVVEGKLTEDERTEAIAASKVNV